MMMRKVDFAGTNLRATRFEGAFLVGANLSHADISGGTFRDARLDGAILIGIHVEVGTDDTEQNKTLFTNAKMAHCRLSNSHIWDAQFDNALLEEADFASSTLYRCNMKEANLTGAQFQPQKEGDSRTKIEKTDFSNANLANAELCNVDIISCDFDRADLTEAKLIGATVSNVDLSTATITGTTDFTRSILEDVVFDGKDMNGIKLEEAVLIGTNFSNVNLSGANFRKARLQNVIFRGCDLAMTNFTSAQFTNSTFEACTISEADFTDIVLVGFICSDSELESVKWDGDTLSSFSALSEKIERTKNVTQASFEEGLFG